LDVSGRELWNTGRVLHDGLGRELTSVAPMLRGLERQGPERCPGAMDTINEFVRLVNQSIANPRSLARLLLAVRTETAEAWSVGKLDENDATLLYRIAQDALTNAAGHGRATPVDIYLKVPRTKLLRRIGDSGEGFRPPPSPYSGMVLKIMRYRAGMIGRGSGFLLMSRRAPWFALRENNYLSAPLQPARVN
jgi:two-component system, LuxR family, sensor kinase FixL